MDDARIALVILLASAVAGCDGGGDEGPPLPACVEVDPGCTPLYEPTFDRVFTETLQPRCGVAGGACHGEAGADGAAAGGLVLTDPDESFAILRGEDGGSGFVQAQDPACSLLVVRLVVDDPELRMPPGAAALAGGELCSVVQWIEQGANR